MVILAQVVSVPPTPRRNIKWNWEGHEISPNTAVSGVTQHRMARLPPSCSGGLSGCCSRLPASLACKCQEACCQCRSPKGSEGLTFQFLSFHFLSF